MTTPIGSGSTDVQAGVNAGNALDSASDLAQTAYSTPETDTATLGQLAFELGLATSAADGQDKITKKTLSIEGIQSVAQRLLDRASASYTALTNLFKSKKQALDAVIQNIR